MRMHARYMANGGRLYHMPGMLHALYGPWMRQDHMPGSYRPAGMDYTRWHAWTVPQFLVPCLWVYQAAIMGPRRLADSAQDRAGDCQYRPGGVVMA